MTHYTEVVQWCDVDDWIEGVELIFNYRQISNISHTLVDNKIVDHSEVDGASPVGAAPTVSLLTT